MYQEFCILFQDSHVIEHVDQYSIAVPQCIPSCIESLRFSFSSLSSGLFQPNSISLKICLGMGNNNNSSSSNSGRERLNGLHTLTVVPPFRLSALNFEITQHIFSSLPPLPLSRDSRLRSPACRLPLSRHSRRKVYHPRYGRRCGGRDGCMHTRAK
jgi:hypothetical protein